jgi:hypothetical protein
MSFGDWSDETIDEIHQGLVLIGWRADSRLTDDDAGLIQRVAREALQLQAEGRLTPDQIDRLAVSAYEIMEFQTMNVDERSLMASGPYTRSCNFSNLVPLIDEATLCYWRGYYTAALASLFIVLESYLLSLANWTPEKAKPSFAKLRTSILKLPAGALRVEAQQMVSKIYSFYDSKFPPQFYFNRHGLLHGMRRSQNVDRMNCVRMYLLFDNFCTMEGLSRAVEINESFNRRHNAYLNCVRLNTETELMQRR